MNLHVTAVFFRRDAKTEKQAVQPPLKTTLSPKEGESVLTLMRSKGL